MTWEDDDSMVMSWIMNSIQPQSASTIAYYTIAKKMREFLRQTYSQDKNSHFEPTMVAKFLAGLSPEYSAAKDQMLTGSEIPDLFDAYNRLSRLAINLSQPVGVTPASALAVGVVVVMAPPIVPEEEVATPTVEVSSSSIAPETVTVSIDRVEYEQFLAHKASQASTSTALTNRSFSAGLSMSNSGFRILHWFTLGDRSLLMVDHQTLLNM
ncbi:hypothetical protein EJ110_NYTH23206 [Nymphaea thermarum]|nr:hypothetical protein EJ110_NYTH23206 [Nymphaea thermarum]